MRVIEAITPMDIAIPLHRDTTVSVPTSIPRLGPFCSVS